MPRTCALTAAVAATLLLTLPAAGQQRVTLPAKDRPLELELRTLFQVGAVEGDEWETFAGITDLAFAPDGSLYVLDGMAHRIFAYDAAGRYRRTIGGPGDGPGEFGLPTSLAVLPSGELVVNDAGKASLQLFSADGSFLRSLAPDDELGRTVGRLRPSGSGLITETVQLARMASPGSGDLQRLQLPPRSVTRITLGDRLEGRRIFNAPPRESRLTSVAGGSGGSQIRMSITAFDPALLWTPLPGGDVAAMHTANYRISLIDGSGRARYLERPITPRKVTDADRKRYLERRRSGSGTAVTGGAVIAFRSDGGAGRMPATPAPSTLRVNTSDLKESDIEWGEVIPVVSGLGADSFGRLWIQRSARDQGDGPIDLVAPDHRYLGTLAPQPMPRAFGPHGRVAYVVRDELDVQRVIVRQLVR